MFRSCEDTPPRALNHGPIRGMHGSPATSAPAKRPASWMLRAVNASTRPTSHLSLRERSRVFERVRVFAPAANGTPVLFQGGAMATARSGHACLNKDDHSMSSHPVSM